MALAAHYNLFRTVVERVFNGWTGLQLAVEHGMGGHNGRNMALQMMDYITDYCCSKNQIDVYDLTAVLDDLMDEEFETLCQDNSTQEIATVLIKFLYLCKSNMHDQVMFEIAQLPQCKLWLCQPQVQNTMPIQPNEIVHDDDDDCIEEGEEEQSEPMDEDVDPGWTVVKTRKKH